MDDFPLHKSVFEGNVKEVSKLIRHHDVSQKDRHGNTPLHIAVMLGHNECVHLLLAHNAPVKSKNSCGWSPVAEAVSYGDRQIVTSLLRKLRQQTRQNLEQRRPNLVAALKQIDDFYLELKWDFQSWVPLVSRILPSDVCKIHKKGTKIRLDTTLVDFNDMKWDRGDITFLYNGEKPPPESLTGLDNKKKVFQKISMEESEREIEEEVDILMGSDIVVAQLPAKNITFTRSQAGWIIRHDKSEMIGNFKSDFYSVHGLTLESRKRREHLSEEDLKKNKAIMENFTKGQLVENANSARRPSLPPPTLAKVTWEEYMSSPAGKAPTLGRPHISKQSVKTFKATVAMSEEFPMTIQGLLDILEVIAPFKQFHKLRDFMQTKLPPGFPVKLELPVFPTVTAKVTFQAFRWIDENDPVPDSKFTIPSDYSEDPHRFTDL